MLHIKFNKNDGLVCLSIFVVYLVTALHHVYGAWLYATPWRNHIAYQGFTWLVISYGIMLLYLRWRKRFFVWLFVLLAGFFFVGAIGFYEGAYNHVLKNVLYFGGMDLAILHKMYPPPKYLLPNDWLFEVTGVLTFGVSLWCMKTMVRWVRD